MSVLNVRDFKEFPACDVLGYSLDFTTASPLDIKSVVEAVKRGRRILEYEPDEDTRKLDVGGVIYDVPRSIGVSDYNSSDGTYVTYKTGTEAASSLTADASLSVRYLAVSASASISYALDKSYKREDQWAMYSFNADTYLASMRNYVDLLAETRLKNRLEDMKPINGNDKNSVEEWKEFFSSWGSHVITNARFGARFQLNVYASNSDSSVNSRFSTSVTAAYDGIVAGGKFDASVKTEDQYRTFMEFQQSKVSVVGGDHVLNLQLTADPTHNDRFVEWAGTVAQDSSITGLNVMELWVLMKEAARKEIRDAANMVKDAYNWIVEHPVPFKTNIVFDIQSDWAEFNLLSPEAVILPDPQHPFPDNTVSSNVRVQWGKEHSHKYERKTLRFSIINDGSPLDFSISHGSNGADVGKGRAEVLMEGTSYLNDKVTDNNWNTMWFYSKPVSRTPATLLYRSTPHKQSWNAALNEYLKQIGVSNGNSTKQVLSAEKAAA